MSLPRRVVLVVGATGQTGVQVARCLAQESLHCSRGSITFQEPDCVLFLVRSFEKGETKLQGLLNGSSGAGQPGQSQCFLLHCADVSDPACLREAFDQAAKIAGGHPVSHVVNTLGTTDRNDSPERSILTATQNLMKESIRVGVKRFVHCGVAYVTRPEAMVAKVLNCMAKNIIGYHAMAEDVIRSAAQASGMDYVIVRPGGLDHGGPGDGIEVSQGDDIKGGSIRRSRLGELLCKALDNEVLPHRPSGGTTMEVCGNKSKDSKEPLEIGWGGFPKNKVLEEDAWRSMLSEMKPDPTWVGEERDHMAGHQKHARRLKISCGCCCFSFLSIVVVASLFGAGLLS